MTNDLDENLEPVILKVTDWKAAVAKVQDLGGRAAQVVDGQMLLVYVPPGTSVDAIGAADALTVTLSPAQQAVVDSWGRARASEGLLPDVHRFSSWADDASPLSEDGPGV